MECTKEYLVQDTLIWNKKENKNFSNNEYVICGNYDDDIFRTIIKFDLKKIRELASINNNIHKIELCFYLKDLKGNSCSECFMTNIGVNLSNVLIDKVTYKSAPKFYQECFIYRVKEEYIERYINFDITKLVNMWINGSYENNGLTMISLNSNAVASFYSSNGSKKPYIKIFYKKRAENCLVKEKKSYGLFTNISGRVENLEKGILVYWDNLQKCQEIRLNKKNTGIIINKGIYVIDYSVNIRSDRYTIMSLVVNDIELEYTRLQIGCSEGVISGHTIVEIEENNSILELYINNNQIFVSNMGIGANIRIISI